MYYVVYGFLYGLSLLPMWFLYGMSDTMSLLLYYVIRYRRGVVASNLLIAFPERSEAERRKIAKKFYRNFTDNFLETLKLLSARPSFLRERFIIDNPEVFDRFYASGRKLHLHMGHTFNWEVANVAMPLLTPYTFIVTYMPIENKVFERLFLRLRGLNGTVLLPATRMRQSIMPYRHTQYILALVADQAPGGPDHSYWLNFFGRPTPFVRSPERGARIADIPAVFAQIYKTKRGHYRSKLTIISDHPAALPEGELTRRYRDILEATIRDQPEVWLWSHKRWKTPFKEEYRRLWID
ncbi:MAG TPA: lysophospholipid acyltransferase family protein [Puia sp.]